MPGLHEMTLPAGMVERGFWLYVWRARTPAGELLYVGRTGDNSSPYASPAYTRMGQHLGNGKTVNTLRQHLLRNGIKPEHCEAFDLIAYGPVHPEVPRPNGYRYADKAARDALFVQHKPLRNEVGAMERRLAVELSAAGYEVMNKVRWSHEVGDDLWLPIRREFAKKFPRLNDERP